MNYIFAPSVLQERAFNRTSSTSLLDAAHVRHSAYVIQEGFEPRTSVVAFFCTNYLLRIYYAETVQLVSYHDGLQSSLG